MDSFKHFIASTVAFLTVTVQLELNPESIKNPIVFVLIFVLFGLGIKQFFLGISKKKD